MKLIRFQVSDHAMALAAAILDIVSPCLREEEKREAFDLFVKAATATLLSYEEKVARLRIEPGKN